MEDQLTRSAIDYHRYPTPGKIAVTPTKSMSNQRDLALAYSPGVAAACMAIARDPGEARNLTSRANLVAVVSNGSAVLGLGNIGALAGKPVMEGKGCLFKKFAGIDVFDIEIDETDPQKIIDIVASLEPTFGGINLEDIKAPECFEIETKLRQRMKIPVFHDDQHGTAIVTAAAILNGLKVVNKQIGDVKLVCSGAGAAAIACLDLLVGLGLKKENILVTDSKGVIYQGRAQSMDATKQRYARDTPARSLADAMPGADIFLGVSMAGVLKREMVKEMAERPLILALANPDPEIRPELAKEVRPDCVIATGRSDYPNQVNNVLGFPYIFRGALDVRASTINEAMKIAAAEALANLAREDVPDEVHTASAGRRLSFGPDYIIPNAFDPRLIARIPPAVARAAIDSGVARKPLPDLRRYARELSGRLDPTANALDAIMESVRANPQRVVFAEGEEDKVVRAAVAFRNAGYGTPVLIGREGRVLATMAALGLGECEGIEIHNARLSGQNRNYADFLYARLQRKGYLARDCQRLVNQDRNVFAACMVATGDAAAMVTGLTRSAAQCLADVGLAIDPIAGRISFGLTLLLGNGRTILIADTLIHERPTAEEFAAIAIGSAAVARRLGHEPRVALVSHSNFGNPMRPTGQNIRDAVALLDQRRVDFEYDGDMSPDVALEPGLRALYPFCRLTGPANVLVMPGLHSAHICAKLAPRLGGGSTIGPLLVGLQHSVQLVPMDASVSQLVDIATLAAYQPTPG
ncbi:MAG: NADP-dependent malic enzyme [Acidisphaera sp.]|nr:NADP-dependent malic enzyme [Acidisphaera sp.]